MRYEIRFRSEGEERVEIVDAPDAPAAASLIQYEHGRSEESFELLSVTLLEEHDHTISNAASGSELDK
ncbi:MAG: hypothetical protein ACJ789_17955 [Thermomicrobiales bacterium]